MGTPNVVKNFRYLRHFRSVPCKLKPSIFPSNVIISTPISANYFSTIQWILSSSASPNLSSPPSREVAKFRIATSPEEQDRIVEASLLSPHRTISSLIRNFSSRPPSKNSPKSKPDTDSDSDSSDDDGDGTKQDHHYSHRGESDFWMRKMRTLHMIFDVNKDGVLSFDDFKLFCERFRASAHLSHEDHARLLKLMEEVWKAQYGAVDSQNIVTTEMFLEEMRHALNDKPLRKKIHKFLPFLFKAVDKDRSGEITMTEYKLFFSCLGLTDEEAMVSFHAVDENEDGKITMKEFVHLGKEFFLSEDGSKASKFFWGPLVHH